MFAFYNWKYYFSCCVIFPPLYITCVEVRCFSVCWLLGVSMHTSLDLMQHCLENSKAEGLKIFGFLKLGVIYKQTKTSRYMHIWGINSYDHKILKFCPLILPDSFLHISISVFLNHLIFWQYLYKVCVLSLGQSHHSFTDELLCHNPVDLSFLSDFSLT